LETSKDDQEIDVSKIMEKIRENIRSRKGNVLCSETKAGDGAPTEIERDLKYINANWQIQNSSYFISSHQPIIGKPLVKMRGLVHGEVRRYVDPVIFRQNEFNACTVRLLNESLRRTDRLEKTIDGLNETLDQWRRETVLETREEMERIGTELDEVVEEKVRSVVAAMNEGIENRAWLAALLDTARRKERDIMEDFKRQHPSILGLILDATVMGLRLIGAPQTTLSNLPRMADFAEWVYLCEPALPWDEDKFLKVYEQSRNEVVNDLFETDPLLRQYLDI